LFYKLFLAHLGLLDTRALGREIANQALNFILHMMSDKSDKINKQGILKEVENSWNERGKYLTVLSIVFSGIGKKIPSYGII